MKKIFLLFVIFMFFGVLTAQEAQNEPVADQNEPAASSEEVKEVTEAAPAEAPAAENQETEAQNAPQEEEKTPETTEKPSEPAPEETKNETPAPAETAEEEPVQSAENTCTCCENVKKAEEKPAKVFFAPTIGAGTGYSIFNVNAGFWFDVLVNRTKNGNNTYLGIKSEVRFTPLDVSYKLISLPIELNALVDFKVENELLAYLGWWFSAGIILTWNLEDGYEEGDSFYKSMAWGTGMSLLFKNKITFIAGINGTPDRFFNLNFALGYRF